jgi:hypothetical protein
MAQGVAAVPSGESALRRMREARPSARGGSHRSHRSAQGGQRSVLGQDELATALLALSQQEDREGGRQVGDEMRNMKINYPIRGQGGSNLCAPGNRPARAVLFLYCQN